jgi:hypothetical protein
MGHVLEDLGHALDARVIEPAAPRVPEGAADQPGELACSSPMAPPVKSRTVSRTRSSISSSRSRCSSRYFSLSDVIS